MPGAQRKGESAGPMDSADGSSLAIPSSGSSGSTAMRIPDTPAIADGLPVPAANQPPPLESLLNSSAIDCDFYAAHGANWTDGDARVHGISYQGGPFSYVDIDLAEGTATMRGSEGVTASNDGETAVRATSSNLGLTFSGFNRRGELVVVTTYAAVDAKGRYRAVMSSHAAQFSHESAQFYGACDIRFTRP